MIKIESARYPSRTFKSAEVIDYITENLIRIDFFYLGYTWHERAELKPHEDQEEVIEATVYMDNDQVENTMYYVFIKLTMFKFETLEDAVDLIRELSDKVRAERMNAGALIA